MTAKPRTRTRLMVAFVAMAAMMFALMPAAPASAHPAQLTVQGTATLNAGTPACGSGSFEGTANGRHGNPVVNARVWAEFTYCSNFFTGTADGTITVAGLSCRFSWLRTGTTAAITLDCDFDGQFDDGTATAHFIVTSAPGQISGPAHVTAVADIERHS